MALLVVLATVLASCGDGTTDEAPAPGTEPGQAPEGEQDEATVRLSIRVDDGRGTIREASIACVGGRSRAAGYLAGEAERACLAARRLRPLLVTEPDADRICTQIFGGPQTATVRGRMDGRMVDRRLSRTNGCEIADWDRAEPLLGG